MRHFLCLILLPNKIRFLLISKIPSPQLIAAHPNDDAPLVGEIHLLDSPFQFRVLLDNGPAVVTVNDSVVHVWLIVGFPL